VIVCTASMDLSDRVTAFCPSLDGETCLYPFTLKKLECLKQAVSNALNTLAWDNKIGLLFYFIGFLE